MILNSGRIFDVRIPVPRKIINGNFLLPNPKLATKLINSLRLKGILLSTDGPYNNVIKIKPPLVFNKDNVNFVCSEIDKFLINEYKK